MPKKGKDEVAAPTPNGIVNRDIIQRMNFLYQASVYLNAIQQPEQLRNNRRMCTRDLAKSYIADMKAVGQKTTVKIDPNVKRTICKGCNTTLIPGSTTSVRVKKSKSHGNIMVYTCSECKTSKRIPAPPNPSAADEASHPQAHSDSSRDTANAKDAQMQTEADSIAPITEPVHVQEDYNRIRDASMQDDSNHYDHTTTIIPPVTAVSSHSPALPFSSSSSSLQNRNSHRQSPGSRALPRPSPHFARDVGHVVFVGSERLLASDSGGVYIS